MCAPGQETPGRCREVACSHANIIGLRELETFTALADSL